jgi:hypothetical protein
VLSKPKNHCDGNGGNFDDQLMTGILIQCMVRYWDLTLLMEIYSDISMVDLVTRKMLPGETTAEMCTSAAGH